MAVRAVTNNLKRPVYIAARNGRIRKIARGASATFDVALPNLPHHIRWRRQKRVAMVRASVLPGKLTNPAITGTAEVGSTLTTSNGTWSNTPTSYLYRWYADGTVIAGATGKTYVPVAGDVGKTITSDVRAVNGAGTTAPATSAATAAVVA